MAEAVRLVIWDLDDTFWRGTVTEGGVSEYLQEHHDIVIELAKRGIISSICSKNDESQALAFLRKQSIADYFVFPSISWKPKGARLAALVEAVRLRAASVMFIDDNPSNRGEAADFVPGLQIEDETFIPKILTDPRFAGKDDKELTRLAQYKLLETKSADRAEAAGDNHAFLRGCNIRIYIEHDVLSHLDRAIELVNRTNQLNYTKMRLPEDVEAARSALIKQISPAGRQSGLVRVVDKYGDYGFIGFYLLQARRSEVVAGLANQTLVHYCFSCRTLGMLVEHWLYDWLRRPELKIVGEVLTNLNVPQEIDWLKMVGSLDEGDFHSDQVAPEIRVWGGWEANALAHYLGIHSKSVKVTGNFASGGLFVRLNSLSVLLSACDRAGPKFEAETRTLGVPYELLITDYFESAPPGTVFVFDGGMDALREHRFRHNAHKWEVRIDPDALPGLDYTAEPADVARKIEERITVVRHKEQVIPFWHHMRENYKKVFLGAGWDGVKEQMRSALERVPQGSKFIFVLDSPRVRYEANSITINPRIFDYNRMVQEFVAEYPFAGAAAFDDFIESDDEIQLHGNHYDRMVYFRLARGIVTQLHALTPKGVEELVPAKEKWGYPNG